MKDFETSSGCTAFWTTYKGKSLDDLSIEELTEAWQALCVTLQGIQFTKDEYENNIRYLVDGFGEITYSDDEPCESCGDYVIQKGL
jgi:hypothetical protein